MKQLTVIGYIRASTPQQRSTILAQYELIQRHCDAYGFRLDPVIRRTVTLDDGSEQEMTGCFLDAAISAEKVDFLLREDAAAMLAHIQREGIRDIIGTKVDRVFRDVDDGRFTVRQLEAQGTRFHLLDVGGVAITLETAAGLFIFTMLATVAGYGNGREHQHPRPARRDRHRHLHGAGSIRLRQGAAPHRHRAVPRAA